MSIGLYAMPESTIGKTIEVKLSTYKENVQVVRFNTLQGLMQSIVESRTAFQVILVVVERLMESIVIQALFSNHQTANLIVICDDDKEMRPFTNEFRPRIFAHSNELLQVMTIVEDIVE